MSGFDDDFSNDFEVPPKDDDYVHFPIDSETGDGFLGSMGRPTGWKLGVLIAAAVLVFGALLSAAFGNNRSPKVEPAPSTVIADKGGFAAQNAVSIGKAIDGGLKAWALFVSTGNSSDLPKYFVEGGDQYQKLLAEKAKTGQFKEEFKNVKSIISSDVSQPDVGGANAHVTFDAYGNGKRQSAFSLNFVLKKGADGVWRTDSVTNA